MHCGGEGWRVRAGIEGVAAAGALVVATRMLQSRTIGVGATAAFGMEELSRQKLVEIVEGMHQLRLKGVYFVSENGAYTKFLSSLSDAILGSVPSGVSERFPFTKLGLLQAEIRDILHSPDTTTHRPRILEVIAKRTGSSQTSEPLIRAIEQVTQIMEDLDHLRGRLPQMRVGKGMPPNLFRRFGGVFAQTFPEYELVRQGSLTQIEAGRQMRAQARLGFIAGALAALDALVIAFTPDHEGLEGIFTD